MLEGIRATSNAAVIFRRVNVGLKFRTLAQTAQDTHAWHQTLSPEQKKFTRAGLSPDKEASVLSAWDGQQAG